ncbi:MAG: acetylxylan esterase [Bacteroidales bacterium]|nr:acetylxylan esterase [Bacteroidales bacterium]
MFMTSSSIKTAIASKALVIGLFAALSLPAFGQTDPTRTRLQYNPETGALYTGQGPRELIVDAYDTPYGGIEVNMVLVTDLSLMSEKKDTVLSKTASANGPHTTLAFPIDELAPGFYQVNLSWKSAGSSGSHPSFNIGVDPEKIVSPQDRKEDFDEFWKNTLAELAATPMTVISKEYSPEHSNSLRNSYRVEITSWNGGKIGGYLCEPVAEGKYPVFIDYMGYGADPYWYDPSAKPDAIEFLVSVRDQGIFKGSQERWIDRGLDSRENFYYRGAFCDVIRAIDFVASLEKADTSRIFARGESQGGAFTFISAALDNRIAAAAPAVPFLGDYRDYSKIVWWPLWEVFETADKAGIDREALFDMLTYFDVKNFTGRITCPIYMAFGLQDPVCPPHTNFSEYNAVKSEKQYFCVPTCGHAMWQEAEWARRRDGWFDELSEKIAKFAAENKQ